MAINSVVDLQNQSIVARATALGSGTLGIVRASGSSVFLIAKNFLQLISGKPVDEVEGFRVYLGKIFDGDLLVDEVTVLVFKEPRSFTGENSLEIICHNNLLIIDHIIDLFLRFGARLAQPGEFSRRAFVNGKIDLLQAEAIHEVISAKNQQSLEKALGQLKGSLSDFLETFKQDLLQIIAVLDAYFEFMEEEVLDLQIDQVVLDSFSRLINSSDVLLRCIQSDHKIRAGIKIVLIGATNAGKSTLFNALARKNKALVSEIHGTTRDTLEIFVDKKGLSWELVDTAGLRDTNDILEQLGIEKTKQEILLADLILLVVDSSIVLDRETLSRYQQLVADHEEKILLVFNKCDLLSTSLNCLSLSSLSADKIFVSGKNGYNIDLLEAKITEKIQALNQAQNLPFLLNKRHEAIVFQISNSLQDIKKMFEANLPYEVIVVAFKQLLEIISDMTGKNLQEEVFSKIFLSFCIGK